MTPSRIGRYEVQRRLGGGGMGDLYLARDPGLERLVAIKVLKADLQEDPGLRERFLREARAVARLSHLNIVMVFEVDEERLFMAMEYIDGQTLKKILYQTPSLPVTKRLSFVEDLCAGLAHAHRAKIIHRDIKPENVMLGSDGVLKILDFGIARLGNSGMTQEGMMMGTLNYMSPEQVTGRGVDERTDIFAAGAVLYESICLKQAFPGQGIDSGVLHRILYEGPVPLNQHVPAIDPDLLKIVQRALDRDPEKRYRDANDMRRDILRVRRRLMDDTSGLVDTTQTTPAVEPGKPPTTGSGRRSDSDRPRRLNPERFAELRRQQVDEHLRFGEEAFERGDHDAALHHAERAATVDPDSRAAFDLIDRARFAIEARVVRQLLAKAQRLLSDGQLDDAAALADEASVTFPDVQGAAELRDELRETVDKIKTARDRAQRIAASLDRARSSMDRGGYETALRAVYEVLAIDPDQATARALEQEAKSRLQAQREHERARQNAYDQLASARALADRGDYDEAVDVANAVSPPSDTVRAVVADVLAAVLKAQRHAAQLAVVARAREDFDHGRLEAALSAIDSIPADDRTPDARTLRTAIESALRKQRELERKRRTLDTALGVIAGLIESGDFPRALERLDDAVRIGVEDERLVATRQRITDLAAAAEERRRQEARDRLAAKRVEAAQELLANGNGYAAVALLERDGSAHPLVEEALRSIRAAIAEQEERVRQETERRRQEEEARRRAQADAAKKAEEQRKAEEHRRRQEEERLRKEAEAQRRREEVATLLISAEKALARAQPDEATLFLRRADEHAGAVEDSALRRRLDAARAEAERLERVRQEEIRRREEDARERERVLTEMMAKAKATAAHEAALNLLSEALTIAPGDSRLQTLVHERRSALEQQRAAEERAREEARRQAEIEAARIREAEAREQERRAAHERQRAEEERAKAEARRQAEIEAERKREAERQAAEQRRRDEEARKREEALTRMLTQAGSANEHEAALTILAEAQTLAPGDTRVHALIRSRQSALDQQRAEAEARAAADEAARLERERAEQRKRDEHAATVVRQAQQLFTAGQHDEALTLLSRSPVHPLTKSTLTDLEQQRAEIARRREQEVRRRQREEQRAARIAAINGALRDRRLHVAGLVVVAIAAGVATWRFWPEPERQQVVQPPPPQRPTPLPIEPPKPIEVARPTETETTKPDLAEQVRPVVQRAQKLYAGRQRPQALDELRTALGTDANNRDALALLNSMIGDARKEMQQAKDEAATAGAQTGPLESYRQGIDNENAGQRAFNGSRRIDAIPFWWSARDGFSTAAREARDAAASRKAEDERNRLAESKRADDERRLADAKKVDDARKLAEAKKNEEDRRLADARRTESERKATEARVAEDAKNAVLARRQADDRAIRLTLQRYEAAWASLNPDAVLSLHQLSASDAANVRRTMGDAREYRMVVQDPNVQLDADGQRATVTANVIRTITPRGARADSRTTATVFTLAKRGDTWIITSMTGR